MVFEYVDHGSVQTKIFMLNYPSFDYESFLLENVVGITMFSLRANLYLVNLHQETLSFYWFDLSNKSLMPIQEFTDPIVSYLQFTLGSSHYYFDGLPLYV